MVFLVGPEVLNIELVNHLNIDIFQHQTHHLVRYFYTLSSFFTLLTEIWHFLICLVYFELVNWRVVVFEKKQIRLTRTLHFPNVKPKEILVQNHQKEQFVTLKLSKQLVKVLLLILIRSHFIIRLEHLIAYLHHPTDIALVFSQKHHHYCEH